MKNGNGTGNIYKMKDKRRKSWVVRVTTGYTLDGKQVRKVVGTYETKREAQESLFEYLKNPKLYSNKTFKEIKELWWESYKKKIGSPKTLETNKYRLRFLEPLNDM